MAFGVLSRGRRHYNKAHKISPHDSASQLGYYSPSTGESSSSYASSIFKESQLQLAASNFVLGNSRVRAQLSTSTGIDSECKQEDELPGLRRRQSPLNSNYHRENSHSIGSDQSAEFQFVGQGSFSAVKLGESNPRLAPQYYKRVVTTRNKDLADSYQDSDLNTSHSASSNHRRGSAIDDGKPASRPTRIKMNARMKRRGQHAARQGNRRMVVPNSNDDSYFFLNPYALSELFSQSEIPGFREIFASDSYLRKFCWIIAFLLMTVASLNDMTELITEYFDYPVTVTLRLRDSPRLPFPSVTVCNLNVVRFSALCSSNVNARYNLTNQIPSEMRDRLCGIQIATNKHKSTMDSDISDINNIGITTTTTTTTTTTSTNAIPATSTTQQANSTTLEGGDLNPTTTTTTLNGLGAGLPSALLTSTSNPLEATIAPILHTTTTVSDRSQRRTTISANGALDLGDFSPRQPAISSAAARQRHPIMRGPFSSRNVRVNVNLNRRQQQLSEVLMVNLSRPNASQEVKIQKVNNPSNMVGQIRHSSALSRSPGQNERQGSKGVSTGATTANSVVAPVTTKIAKNKTINNDNNNMQQPQVNNILTPSLPEDFGYNERIDRELQENLTNWLAVMYQRDPQLTLSLGHQFEDMILRCTMKFNNCTHERSFVDTFSPTEGNCFTYKSKMRRGNKNGNNVGFGQFDEVNLAGANQGLELVLNLEKNEYISGSSQVGALVMIHHPGDDSGYAASEATFIAPEFTTYIGLKMVNITRLPAPYPEKCVHSWPDKFADRVTRNRTYSQQGCMKTCLQRTIQKHCQCQSATLPILELDVETSFVPLPAQQSESSNNLTLSAQAMSRIIICDTRKQATRQCVADVTLRAAERVHNCDCPPKCQVVRYDKTVSMARWPTREDKVTFDRSKVDFNFQNLAKVIVYYQTMTCDEITQQPVYNAAKLFSSLGGIMGMYVGFSFLSIFEIFEVVTRKTWHHYRMKWTNK